MKNLLAVAALALALAAPARASTYSVTTDASSTTLKVNGRLHMQTLAGVEQLVVDSVKGLFTWTYGIQASTASFTATGADVYDVDTSSGIRSQAGTILGHFIQATNGFFGNLTGNADTATSATTATNLASGAAGSVPYQTDSSATSMLAAAAGKFLSIVGTTPTWLSYVPETVTVSTANVTPGFNAANRLVQLNGSAQYPALDGSLITNLSGTLAGGVTSIIPRWASATSLDNNSFINAVSSGVTISSNVTLGGATASSVTLTTPNFYYSSSGSLFPFMVPVATAAFTNVTVASVTLPAGYSEYYVIGTVQNTNAAARTLTARFGGDVTSGNYQWMVYNLPGSVGEFLSCSPSAYINLTDSTSNTGRVATSGYAGVTMHIHKAASNVIILDHDTDVNHIDSDIFARMVGGGRYTGTSQSEIEFGMSVPASCTSTTFSANSISGVLRIYALP